MLVGDRTRSCSTWLSRANGLALRQCSAGTMNLREGDNAMKMEPGVTAPSPPLPHRTRELFKETSHREGARITVEQEQNESQQPNPFPPPKRRRRKKEKKTKKNTRIIVHRLGTASSGTDAFGRCTFRTLMSCPLGLLFNLTPCWLMLVAISSRMYSWILLMVYSFVSLSIVFCCYSFWG